MMMILGTGLDIVEVDRVREMCSKWDGKFEERIFTRRELAYCKRKKQTYQSLAARFAAKEALFKALGTGWSFSMCWKDVEITNDKLGKPNVILSGKTQKIAEGMGVKKAMVSLSHTKQYAVANVILMGEPEFGVRNFSSSTG